MKNRLWPWVLLALFCATSAFAQTPATMSSPTPGTPLPGSSVTFSWTTGTGVSSYWLWIGTSPGSLNLYDAGQGTNTSVTVNGLPTNGISIYVRLFSVINGVYQYNDYVYTAYVPPPAPATMISPTPSTTLTGSSVTFNWTTGTSVGEYWLWVGTAPGAYNLYDANQHLNTSVTVSGLPTNGIPVYVRLFSWINGAFQYNDYTYTAYTTPASPATMISPAPNSTLTGSSATFNWSTGTGVTEYWLWVGSAPGTYNYYDANQHLNTSVTVSGLPTNGSTIYVRLFSWINGAFQYNDYVYTSPSGLAVMTSPNAGSTLTGSSVTFNWTAGTGVTSYWLWVGTSPGSLNVYDAGQGLNTSVTVNNLPTNGTPLYVRLFSVIKGVYEYNDYTYTQFLQPNVPAAMLTPAPATQLPDTTVTFDWNAGHGATEYWLWIGSSPGTYNYYDANQHLNLSTIVSGLPQDGTPVYVRLFSYINGAFQYNDYTYRASLPSQPVVSLLNTNNPQVAQYSIIVPKDGQVSVNFGLTATYNLTTNQVPAPAGGGRVNIFVAGMLPNSTYHMQANISYNDATSWQDIDRTFTTGALPTSLTPGITIQQPNPLLTPSPGIELVNGLRPTNGQVQVFATDLQGNIIWYYVPPETNYQVNPVKLLPNGNMMLLMGGSVGTLREIDLAGNTVHDFNVGALQNALNAAGYTWTVNAMHHEFLRLANGHTILLIDRNKVVNGTTLLGDQIVDLDPNYNVVWLWDSFDHLDTSRFPYGFSPTSDWTHGNALFYSPVDGSLLFSMRHQSWVIKIDYNNGAGTGNVLWRFGFQGDFTIATNPSDWQFGQHNPTIISQNGSAISMSVFDDGNYRVDANGLNQCDGNIIPCYSRNVIYDFDENTKTAQVSWAYAPSGVFSQATGSSQLLPNGDMEASFNFIFQHNGTSRIIETTRDPVPQVVWEFDLSGETAYRSTRLGSLYPGVQW